MKILSIESSCDETSAAVVELVRAKSREVHHEPSTNSSKKASGKRLGIEKDQGNIQVLSNVTATSLPIHAKTGGIIPENAAREQVKYIIPVITRALNESKNMKDESWETAREILKSDIDAIAVTYGPGLIGSLLVGVETAKTLSFTFNKPLIPVNHLLAHLYANFIERSNERQAISFPFIGLIVSGGHTDLLLFKDHGNFEWLGGTRDDAAGEALDKIGRLIGLPYPAGAEIEYRAQLFSNSQGLDIKQPRKLKRGSTSGEPLKFHSPLMYEQTFDFSFSGLKTEALRFTQKNKLSEELINEVCFAVQKAVIDVLIKKTLKAAKEYNCKTILLGGGVSANSTLREKFESEVRSQKLEVKIFSPEKIFCTDNGAMIGVYALMNPVDVPWKKVCANPELYFI